METQETQAARRPPRAVLLIILLVIAVGAFAFWFAGRGWEATDDAQVAGSLVPINARVAGYVDRVLIADNQLVAAGQLLTRLDSRDLSARLRNATANLALQKAQAAAAATQVMVVRRTSTAGQEQAGAGAQGAEAGVAAAQSQVAFAEAQAASARANADAARDAIAAARSDVETAKAQIDAARAAAQAARADVSSADAQATRAAEDATRFERLYRANAVSKQEVDAVTAGNVSARAALAAARERVRSAEAVQEQARSRQQAAQAGLRQAGSRSASAQSLIAQAQAAVRTARTAETEARARLAAARASATGAHTAEQQIAISEHQTGAARARVGQAEADFRNAQLLLSYTRIVAPVAGVVSQKSVDPGQYVQPGQMLMSVVPLNDVWVVANFKETQLTQVRPGQRAVMTVDTYPGVELRGRVSSIAAATGAKFSLLPPENATGNFVKVVQRVPVKIVLDRPLPEGVVLRPGLNVTAKVRVGR